MQFQISKQLFFSTLFPHSHKILESDPRKLRSAAQPRRVSQLKYYLKLGALATDFSGLRVTIIIAATITYQVLTFWAGC